MRQRDFLDPLVSFLTAWGLLAMPTMLSAVAANYKISIQLAGQTSTASAIALAVGGPITVWLARGVDSGKLLRIALAVFAGFQCLSAFATTIELLLVCRFFVGLGASVIFPLIASRTASLAQVDRVRQLGRLSIAFTLAATLGMPLVALAVDAFGWRSSLLVIGVSTGLFLLLIRTTSADRAILEPTLMMHPPLDRKAIIANAAPLLVVTTLQSVAQMSVFTYLDGLIPHQAVGSFGGVFKTSSSFQMGWVYFVFGLSGILGNLLLPRLIGRLGAVHASVTLMLSIAAAFAIWSRFATVEWQLGVPIVIWGLAGAAIGVCQQSRLIETRPEIARILSASHSSCIYVGQAIGAGCGGIVISHFGIFALLDFGMWVLLGACAFNVVSARPKRRWAC